MMSIYMMLDAVIASKCSQILSAVYCNILQQYFCSPQIKKLGDLPPKVPCSELFHTARCKYQQNENFNSDWSQTKKNGVWCSNTFDGGCVYNSWCLVLTLLQQWHRTPTTQETDGFQVKRPGDVNVRCTLLLMLDYQV